jgi:hypothetical protein
VQPVAQVATGRSGLDSTEIARLAARVVRCGGNLLQLTEVAPVGKSLLHRLFQESLLACLFDAHSVLPPQPSLCLLRLHSLLVLLAVASVRQTLLVAFSPSPSRG